MDRDLEIPALRIGRFEIVELVGSGGMGRVFRARDPTLDREVALKLLRDVSSEAQARMLREARTMAALSHPNVVPVYDVDIDGDDVFIAMELVRGDDLRVWMPDGPHPWREVVRVFAAAGRGLSAAHEAGLVHRDFKPANVMLGNDGRVRVMDFGLARSAPAESSDGEERTGISRDPLDDGITRDGDIVGTPHYMAPELETGATTTAAGDQYAFAMALYEALYDQSPFAGTTREQISMQKWSGEIRPAPRESPVPRPVFEACVRGLSGDPLKRFPSVAAFVDELERSIAVGGSRRTFVAAVVVLGGLAGGASWILAARDRCAAADEAVNSVWNAERRTELDGVLGNEKVVERLDAYFTAWTDARHRLCEGEAPPDVDRYRACLDAQLQQGAAVVDVLVHIEGDAVERASVAADTLPDVESCADAERRDRLAPPPELAVEVDGARSILSRVATTRRRRGPKPPPARASGSPRCRDGSRAHAVVRPRLLEHVVARARHHLLLGRAAVEAGLRGAVRAAGETEHAANLRAADSRRRPDLADPVRQRIALDERRHDELDIRTVAHVGGRRCGARGVVAGGATGGRRGRARVLAARRRRRAARRRRIR